MKGERHSAPRLLASDDRPTVVKAVTLDVPSPLSPTEKRELARYEEIIAKGWDTFIAVGQALTHIRNKRLYGTDFHSFEAYCHHKWHYRRAHAYRLIGAAEVMQILSPIGDISLPRNEAQVRPLLGLNPQQVQTVWRKVLALAGKGQITASLVKEAVAELRQPPARKPIPKSSPAIPDEVTGAARKAEKFLIKAKRCIKQGHLAKTMILLHHARLALHLDLKQVESN